VQLTTPLGRAADRADLVLQPYELTQLVPRVAALKRRAFEDGILLMPGNNLGYFGPEETLLRSRAPDGKDHYQGCLAGSFLLGIESDGSVKGCPSLQSDAYVGGNLRTTSLPDLWRDNRTVGFSRNLTVEGLWGFCAECTFRETCLGGCTFTAHAVSGRPGNNPYCHYRARTLASRGRRERIVQRTRAPGVPFDNAIWDIVEEPLDAPTEPVATPSKLVQIRRAR
jgi:radical SAM protein with 4Fe4S-binding SPASM domain